MAMAGAVERLLMESHHYALCRALGQLDGVSAVPVADAATIYERVCTARGQRAGAVKPAALDAGFEWDSAFADASLATDVLTAT